MTEKAKLTMKKKSATHAQSEDWDMLPDVEDLEKIVDRELKKLKEFERANTAKK